MRQDEVSVSHHILSSAQQSRHAINKWNQKTEHFYGVRKKTFPHTNLETHCTAKLPENLPSTPPPLGPILGFGVKLWASAAFVDIFFRDLGKQ